MTPDGPSQKPSFNLKPVGSPVGQVSGDEEAPRPSGVAPLKPALASEPAPPVKAPVATTAPAPVSPPVGSSMAGRSVVEALGPAMLLPFRSNGPLWLFCGALVSPFFFIQLLQSVTAEGVPIIASVRGLVATGIAMTLYARFFQVNTGASMHEYDQFPSVTSFGGMMDGYVMPGMFFTFFFGIVFLPYWMIGDFTGGYVGNPVAMVALVIPLVCWISALLLFAITDSKVAMFNFKAIWGIISAYPKVTGGMVAAFGVATLVFLLLRWLALAAGGSAIAAILAGIYFPWVHGVLGAMYGRVLVAYPRILEIAQEDEQDSRQ